MSTYATLSSRALRLVDDPADFLTDDAKNDAFREALTTYSIDRPRTVVEDLSGDGSTYDFTLGANYLDGFSQIHRVEYPAGERPAQYLEPDDYGIYRTSSTAKLRLHDYTPGATETVRVTYTARHTLNGLDSAVSTTIETAHLEAIVRLAAANLLDRLAAHFLNDRNSSLNADIATRADKADVARRLARQFEADYRNAVGLNRGVQPGGVVIDWDRSFAGTGLDFLTHRKQHR